MQTYLFKAYKKFLQFSTADGLKVMSNTVTEVEPQIDPQFRTGDFDNQRTSAKWTWAWTTDLGPFEIWRPSGIYLSSKDDFIFVHQSRFRLKSPARLPKDEIAQISIGRTGPISFGLIAQLKDGSVFKLIKDTQPYFDAVFNVTYDDFFCDEDFFPHVMMGREISKRLGVKFNQEY